ncbi:BPTI/Kunitz domain-containing protein-like, partial [Saccostrea echinata]|uniref:BPTI/Kunitz domain-containing protein-like n=1 Tax=Saccostrea echinata TaxID=191078 RepID=UPI002A829AF1
FDHQFQVFFFDLKCCSFGCGCRTSCVKPVYEPGPQSGGCFYNGRYYPLGESIPSTDGCNTCFCTGNGQVGCTLIGCPDLCTLPKAPGACRGYFPRWWYNSFTNQCEVFIYGGCEGNDNRFQTIHECLQRCAKRKY